MPSETRSTPARGREGLVTAGAIFVVVAVAVVVLALLNSARSSGIDALEEAKVSQVDATAASFDSRVVSALQGVASLGVGWELTEDSSADEERLQSLFLDPGALSGSLLLDEDDTITQGLLLSDAEIGDTYAPDWWPATRAALEVAPAAVSSVGDGVTTDLPIFALVIAISDADDGTYRGALVVESAIHAESAFTLEIVRLAGDEDAGWYFVDGQGSVVASNRTDTLGDPAPLPLDSLGESDVLRQDGRFYVSGAVPSVGWQVVFATDVSTFEGALADPLQVAGIVLALSLAVVAAVFVVVLSRRLAAAREEERRIRQLASSQEEFVSIVSHELRTPVAGVLGFLQTSLDHWDGMDDEQRLHAMRRAVSNARRLQALTRDVLDAESVEAGRLSFDFHRVDLVDELRMAAESAVDVDRARLVELEVPEGPVWVEADPDRLQQVLGNLLENARKNSPAESPITLGLEPGDDAVTVSVVDRGAGISPEAIDRVFDKFVRARGSSVAGTGLGLYVSRRIVEAHHGEISAESGDGTTTFQVRLPRQHEPDDGEVATAP